MKTILEQIQRRLQAGEPLALVTIIASSGAVPRGAGARMLVGKQGYTLVPLSLYFSGKNVKMELGLCRGKKLYDKRETEAKKQAAREIDRYERESRK